MPEINSIQVRRAKIGSTGFTDLNHISNFAKIKPEHANYLDKVLFSSTSVVDNFAKDNTLASVFGINNTEYVDDWNFSWSMKAKTSAPITIIENRTTESPTKPGQFGAEIKLLVDRDFAVVGETWSFGSSDKSQVVNLKDKSKEARGYLYTFVTATDGVSHYIKPEYLEPGNKLTRMFNLRGEAAESGSHTEFGTNIMFKNWLNKSRKEYKVTDFAAQAKIQVAVGFDDGTYTSMWISDQDLAYRKAMNKELNNLALYGRLSDTPWIDPDSKYPIYPGAGLQQQISFGGNVEGYNVLSAELIEAFIKKIVYSRIAPGDLGDVIAMSGYAGMEAFTKALDKWSMGKSIVRESNFFMQKDPKGWNRNSLAVGYNFTKFNLPMGGSFTMVHNPSYDDPEMHRDLDENGIPKESQRITILDITGKGTMGNNVKIMKKNKVAGTTVIEGRYDLSGNISKNPKHRGDYSEVHISDSMGIKVIDPSLTGELIKR